MKPTPPFPLWTALLALTMVASVGRASAQAPDWQVDAESFEASMSATAIVFLDGEPGLNPDNVLAAFSGTEVRGVSTPTFVRGDQLFFLTIFGDNSQVQNLSFKVYDANSNRVFDVNEELAFEADGVVGSIEAPLVLTTGLAGANAPDWSVDEALYGLSMSIVGSLFIDGNPNIHPASRVGAFVGEELRGVAGPLLIGGRSLYFLTVYANGEGEPITFRAYDATTDRVRGVDFPVVFDANALIGSTSVPYLWRTAIGQELPSWTPPDSTVFGLKMTLVGRLLINDDVSTHPDNIVAAFSGDELRGSALPEFVDGHLVFPMTIYADAGGDTIRFEAYDAAADRVRAVLETIVFEAGAVTGTPANPFLLSTALDPPQAAPTLLSPPHGEIDVQLDPTLIWDAVPRAVTFEVQLATSEDFSGAAIFSDLPSTSLPLIETLDLVTTYYWRVRAVNGGGPGPWSRTRRFTTIRPSVSNDDPGGQIPTRFALSPNHPNPFSQRTEIRYELANAAHVRLAVHDVLGRVAATLVNDVQSAGKYEVAFEASGLGSGVYFYRIEAGAFIATRTMTILK